MAAPNFFDLARSLAVRAPHAVDLLERLQDTSRPPLPTELLRLGANVARPGSGEHVAKIIKATARIIGGKPINLDLGDAEPWDDFATHYAALPWGIVCIYGDPGQGKTALAIKSCANWEERDNRPTELCGFYEGDQPDFGTRVSMQRLIARMRKVARFLNQEEDRGAHDGLSDEEVTGRKKKVILDRQGEVVESPPSKRIDQSAIDAMGYRNVIIDEAGVFFGSLGASNQQDTREAAKRFSDQVRHLNSRFIFIAQKQGDIPPHVRASALNIYKQASRGVVQMDFKPGTKRDTMQRWEEALTALHAVKTGSYVDPLPDWMDESQREAIHNAAKAHIHFEGDYGDIRAWGYAVGALGGHMIRTVFPFSMYTPDDPNVIDADSWSVVE